ncbi:TonB-dependent receptor [Sulfurovum sp. XTW-4]|uniref:TonB-dependent receptor n=1 Tax=Sulfurovum xiamenensis TaxID=3019066 RepID=A0ABT7QP12_9BACT|nr:TonB-dependent receptor [Sulfurovum xiamenensis]MDM5262619.1 TonB-dependent receptor [Sulfurovum xiamenensis]
MTFKSLSLITATLLLTTPNYAEELENITITSTSFEISELDAPSSVDVYTHDDIEASNSDDIFQFLNEQTSVTSMPSYSNPFIQNLDLRGYGLANGYQNIVITVDGRRMNNIDNVPQLLSAIPLEDIEQIEILKGGSSVRYGDGANAGSINIITKTNSKNYVKSYMGSQGRKFGAINLSHQFDNLIVKGYMDYFKSDGLKQDERYSKNKFVSMKYFPTDTLELSLKRSFAKMQTKYPNPITLDDFNNNIEKDNGFNEQYLSSYVTSMGLTYDITPNLSLDLNYNDENKKSEYISPYPAVFHYKYKSLVSQLKYTNEQTKILLGFELFNGDRQSTTDTTSKDNQAFFISAAHTYDKSSINIGARYEKVTYNHTPTSGADFDQKESLQGYNLGYNYKLNNTQSLFVNFDRAYQAPNIDNFFAFNWSTFALDFNPDIKPMKTDTLSVGLNAIDPKNKLKITLFGTKLKDEIYYYNSGSWLTSINTNIDKSYKYGLELFDKYNINENFYTSVNYRYVIAKIDSEDEADHAYDGKYLPGVSKHNVTLNLGTTFGKFSGVLSHTYKSKAYASDDFENNFSQKQKAYNSTNLSLKYTLSQYAELFAKAENIFDQKNGIWISDDVIYPINFETIYYAGIKVKF